MHPVCKVWTTLTLFLLIVYHTDRDNCHAMPPPLTHPKREGYSRLTRDLKSHPVVRDKVPPGISRTHATSSSSLDVNEAVNATFQLMPIEVLSLDPARQTLEMSTYIRLAWRDANLAWNASDYGGVDLVELTVLDVWTPILSLMNGVQEDNDLTVGSSVPLSLYDDGAFNVVFSAILKTTCALDLTMFPFDEQSCELIVYCKSGLATHVRPGDDITHFLLRFSVGGEWVLTDISAEADPGFDFRLGIEHTVVVVRLRRKTLFYMVGVVLPMGLFTAMNCLVFLIPPETGEKISFIVSMFISNTVFSSFVNGQMPRGLDDKVPLLMAYLTFMWAWSIVIFLATLYVISRFHEERVDRGDRSEEADTNINRDRRQRTLAKRIQTAVSLFLTKPKSQSNAVVDAATAASDHTRRVSTDDFVLRSPRSRRAQTVEEAEAAAAERAAGDHCTLTMTREEEDGKDSKVKAKSLDRIFLFGSFLITAVVDTVFIAIIVCFS